MTSINPFNVVNLHGTGCFRSVTLALPIEQVARFLPAQLELGAQNVTPPGTHPVILSFNALTRAEMSIPSLLPSLTYNEFTFGIPYTMARRGKVGTAFQQLLGRSNARVSGPFYYMPQLFLDSVLATLGGILYWGYAKRLARFKNAANRVAIDAEDGSALTSLDFNVAGEARPVTDYPHFAPIQAMLNQPLVSQMPVALGPVSVVADFDKHWPSATLRPLHTAVTVQQAFVQGFGLGRFPAADWSEGIDTMVMGSYELQAPWRLGMAHMPLL